MKHLIIYSKPGIPVIFRKKVNIMEDETVPLFLFHGYIEPNVHASCSVESSVPNLETSVGDPVKFLRDPVLRKSDPHPGDSKIPNLTGLLSLLVTH